MKNLCVSIIFHHPSSQQVFRFFHQIIQTKRIPFFSAQLNTAIGALLAGLWLLWLPKDVEVETEATGLVPWQSWAWLSALLAVQNSLEILSIPRAPWRNKMCCCDWQTRNCRELQATGIRRLIGLTVRFSLGDLRISHLTILFQHLKIPGESVSQAITSKNHGVSLTP